MYVTVFKRPDISWHAPQLMPCTVVPYVCLPRFPTSAKNFDGATIWLINVHMQRRRPFISRFIDYELDRPFAAYHDMNDMGGSKAGRSRTVMDLAQNN